MSDTEQPRASLVGAIAGLGHTWQGPVVVEDLRDSCCKCHGVPVLDERPCFWLYNVLSDAECEALTAATLEHHDSPLSSDDYAKDPGCRSQFTSDDAELSSLLWQRIRESVPDNLDGGVAFGLMTQIAHCRYFPGQVGFPHMDFRHSLRKQKCVVSRISFTVYLNDDYEGGELGFIGELRLDGTHGEEHLRVRPRKGSAVLFYQGVPEFAHLPHEITSGCKSIMRADVLYQFDDERAADVGCVNLN
jgi:hypothetical protein